MGKRPLDTCQPAWVDVSAAIREVEKAHSCNIHVRLSIPLRADTPVHLWAAVEAEPRIVAKLTIRQPVAVGHRFPSVDCATLESLVYRLVLKLDHDLDEFGHVPAEQAMFAWDEGK